MTDTEPAPDDSDGMARRYPLQPVADLLGIELGRIGGSQPGQPLAGLAALAERLGISHTMAQRLNTEGLSYGQADEYAVGLGLHPSALWPEWWHDVEPDPDFYEPEDPLFLIFDTGGTQS